MPGITTVVADRSFQVSPHYSIIDLPCLGRALLSSLPKRGNTLGEAHGLTRVTVLLVSGDMGAQRGRAIREIGKAMGYRLVGYALELTLNLLTI